MALVPMALIGGAITLAVLWPLYGALIAFVCVPFGGSFSALLVALLLVFVEAHAKRKQEHRVRPPSGETKITA